MQPWFIAAFYDIGHPCYGQLIPVKTRYPLTSIMWPYRGLAFRAHRRNVFFKVDRCPRTGFSIGSRAQVRLTCCKRGRVVRKPVNANPGLKFNRSINIYWIQMFCFVYFEIIQFQNRGPKNIYGKPHYKVAKVKSKFFLNLGYLNRALNNAAQELRF